jgi:hypothetical protein
VMSEEQVEWDVQSEFSVFSFHFTKLSSVSDEFVVSVDLVFRDFQL